MFESICIHEQAEGPGDPLDLGFLAEALLFYQNVRVAGHGTALRQIVPAFGPDVLFEFLQRGYLSITYLHATNGKRQRVTLSDCIRRTRVSTSKLRSKNLRRSYWTIGTREKAGCTIYSHC